MRLIDADALQKAVTDLAPHPHDRWETIGVWHIIEHMPTLTLDDLRRKGRWNPLPEDDREQMIGDQCSLCGYEHFGSRFNFCPHCGADMRGE